MIVDEDQYLAHYGILRKSGRYPWGSGKTQSARNRTFLDTMDDLKKNHGMSEAQIAEFFSTDEVPLSSTQIRALKTIAGAEQKQAQINQAERLRERGWGYTAIGERMGVNESTVRSLLAPGRKNKAETLEATAEMLRRQVAEKELIQIGSGVELDLPIGDTTAGGIGLSKDKFQTAVAILREEGYEVHTIPIKQIGTGKDTNMKVLAKPGTEWKTVAQNKTKIRLITEHSPDGGKTYVGLRPPTNISSKRVGIVYAEQGGTKKDGLIELRPGVKDLDLGGANYAQVRIAVDSTHYLKGMAVYNDKLPEGIDVRFNTNKSDTGSKHDAMKAMEKGPDGKPNLANPFTASIKPGGQRGALNIINEEGDWDKHSKNLPSQMLSKQSPALAKQQLSLTQERSRNQLDEIKSLTNPAVKRKLLETYADSTDSAAVSLKAASMPRQASKVLLPIPEVKPTEIYAPSFQNGDRVALVRFPHGGTFEIPDLVVNNKNPVAKRLLGTHATDAVGINHKVAERLSGADFDGDHVLVIPNNLGSVKSTSPLEGLKGFDPKAAYPPYDGMRTVDGGRWNAEKKDVDYPPSGPSKRNLQIEMGKVSNLITDMTIKDANTSELARAVRHSMVVIDSEKHHLDYKQSAEVNGIRALKERYQGRDDGRLGGASTLISRANADKYIVKRKGRSAAEGGPIDKNTGKLVFVDSGKMRKNKKGELVPVLEKVPFLSVVDDAHQLVSEPSGTVIEHIYADHSNKLKAMANEARKELVNTKPIKMQPSAKKVYASEVASLNSQLRVAEKNAPRERQAQVVAHAIVEHARQSNPNMDKDDLKKVSNRALAEARVRTGADKTRIDISDREWEAIQSGAISNHQLEKILNHADIERVKELATPRKVTLMTSSKTVRAKQMLQSGYTQAEVASALGVSLTTLKTSISG